MIKRVLVTGSNGQLGKTIKELYKSNIFSLDLFFVSKEELDITNKNQLQSFFRAKNIDYCINCAAYTNVEQAEKTPEIAFEVNAEGVKYLAETCKDFDVVLIHISTDYVFDGEKTEPYTIKDKTNPINEYGKSKLLGENFIQDILNKHFIIRTSWLYSKKYGNNFYKTILKKAKSGEALSITAEQIGCPTNTENLANYILNLITNKSTDYGVKHFCDEKAMTWYDFAKKILLENDLSSHTSLVKANNYRTFAKRPKNSILLN
ncbi:dTDP-4-dehydrorhamnose reductase [Sabulilitoribacter multivorans]|uniref:dTDP-4-dehydrorhamnose reductase n=1 Tax=Flaviramulus multivorans TaxID=1304750 RepID=A0ABS9IFQ2_9FLAO|nr:dTDP-4-dehydrorhamnose reductase [Flaviramulus multivorans]MCF7559592.1 dTDP-4-dehydrorhamnose reductase [Flaviramulus multivorans]